jgi:peptidoglycan hydrolase CwlO-like protein
MKEMQSDMTEQELRDLKAEIEESRENLSKNQGKKEALMEQLQKKFGVDSIEAAEEKLKLMEAEVEEWDKKITTATEELETTLNGKQDTTTAQPTRTRKRKSSEDPGRSEGPTRRTPR